MQSLPLSSSHFLRAVLDAVPSPVFVIDPELRIHDANKAAADWAAVAEFASRKLCGEVLHCSNAASFPGGCGATPACPQCVIRGTVEAVLKSGNPATRQRGSLQVLRDGTVRTVETLVTVSPFRHDGQQLALVIVEDITDVVELARLIPICSSCKKIRKDDTYWESVDAYLSRHAHLHFTHGICPDCAAKMAEQ